MKREQMLSPPVTVTLLSLLAAGAAAKKLSDPDTWWHLAGGRLVLSGGIPSVNTFSHTWPDQPWQYTQWLFGVVLHGVELLGGVSAVSAVPMLATAVAAWLILATVRRHTPALPFAALLPLFVLALTASRFRFVARPHLVTFVGLALLLFLYARRPRRMPLWFGLIGALWANCHAGVVFGLAIALIMPLADVIARRHDEARQGAIAAGFFFVGSLCNPNPFYPYLYSFMHLEVYKVVALGEFRRATLRTETSFYLFAALAFLAIPFRVRRRDYFYPLALTAFFTLAVYAVRIVPKFVIVALPGLALTVVELWERARTRRGGAVAAWSIAVLGLAVATWCAARDYGQNPLENASGWGYDERIVPEGAARVILDRNLPGKGFNEFDQGGYFIWRLFPGRRVFVDGRVQAYPPDFFRELMSSFHGNALASLLERHDVDFALVQRRFTGSRIDLAGAFSGLGWRLAYLDGLSYLMVRPGSDACAALDDAFFSRVRPGQSEAALIAIARADPMGTRGELARIAPERLFALEDFRTYGAAAAVARDPVLAERFLGEGVRHFPRDPVLRINLGQVLIERGSVAAGRQELETARTLGRGTPFGEEAARRLNVAPAPAPLP